MHVVGEVFGYRSEFEREGRVVKNSSVDARPSAPNASLAHTPLASLPAHAHLAVAQLEHDVGALQPKASPAIVPATAGEDSSCSVFDSSPESMV